MTLLALLYAYVGYPMLLAGWAARVRRGVRKDERFLPRVSIVIAAYNEADRLGARLTNCLELDYPAEQLEVVVVSDGSTDKTEAVLRRHRSTRLRWSVSRRRLGKAAALNAGVSLASGEIVVFTDVRQRFAPDAVRRLVANLADPRVGAVTGELVLVAPDDTAPSPATDLYWRFEKWIRKAESRVDSVIGVTGAIYAIRRELFEPLPVGTILDDVLIPMRITLRGYRVVFEDAAIAWDHPPIHLGDEYRRKVRTLAGNYQVLALLPALWSPRRNRLWFQYLSHKLTRLTAPFALMGLLATSALLAPASPAYALVFLLQAAGYALAAAGWLWGARVWGRLTSVPLTFVMLNYAALLGLVEFLRLRNDAEVHRLWVKPETHRRAS